jgi:hypothetical protein
MSSNFFSILALIFFIGCSTTPVKYDKPVKVDDYKHFVRLKEKKDDSVSKKTFGQKLKEAFTTNPKVKTNKVEIKKSDPPKRRIRKTNTSPVLNNPGKLMSMTRQPAPEPSPDIGKTIMLYLIYLQALIIAIFAYAILRHQKKLKKVKIEKRELNL